MIHLRSLIVALAALAVAPITADAAKTGTVLPTASRATQITLPAPAVDPRVTHAQAIAAAAWGDPCNGRVRVEWIDFRRDPRVPGAHPLTWGAASQDGCANGNDQGLVMLNARRTYTKGRLRTVLCHEYGHLAGWRDPVTGDVHSSDPFSLMWPDQFPHLWDDGSQERVQRPDGRWAVRHAYVDQDCHVKK